MTCQHCCDANDLFDKRTAKKELKKFRKSGAKGATKKIIKLLTDSMEPHQSLLDVGGGIGAIQWKFLSAGGSQTTDVDASHGYLEVAQSYAREQSWKERTSFKAGDLVDVYEDIEVHDFVTLDKVVCCYPDFRKLLSCAGSRSKRVLFLSMPRDNFIFKGFSLLGKYYFIWKGSAFRTYIHSAKDIQKFMEQNGFKLKNRNPGLFWLVYSYERVHTPLT